MAALDFTGVFEDEELEEVAVKEQTVQPTAASSRFSGVFDDDEETVETEAVEEQTAEEDVTSRFDNVFDDDDVTTAVEQPSREPIIEETPEQIYMRTGEAPAGYKTVPTVPTADTGFESLGVKLELIDAPKPTVSEQTDSAFGYEGTKEMAELFSEPIDIIGAEEFVEENIPESIQPIANWVGSAVNKDLANLVIAMEAAAETTANIGVGLTKGLKAIGVDIPFEDRDAGEKFAGDIGMALEMIEAVIPGGSSAMRPVRRLYRDSARKAKDKVKAEKAREKLLNRKMNINRAKTATAEEIAAKTTKAEQVAAENVDLKNELILGFEDATGKTISREVDGVRVVDDDLARQAGRETAEEIDFKDTRSQTAKALGISDVEADDAAKLAGVGDTITAPILKPEKLDGLVAAAADLKGKYPTAFDNDKTVIDNLLDLTINKELIAGDELIDTLNKYNVSFEDYILTVVGSGSEAGKVLNKLSQIKRARPLNEMQELCNVPPHKARQG